MPRRLRRFLLLCICLTALMCLLGIGANAYTYPKMPSDWQNVQVTVGDVTMPFARYPDGSYFSGEKSYMTQAEQADYGLSLGRDLYLRGWECVAFARYTYAALFFKYPQDAVMDTTLAYEYSNNYAYVNMISKVLGTKTLAAGYSAETLKTLITSCQPGAVMRAGGHSMVVMAIYDDGMIIYDANFSSDNQVSVRPYTWAEFVASMGGRGIQALQMPSYYPGWSYSTGDNSYYAINGDDAGNYEVNASYLNVRSRPTTSSTILGEVHRGDILEVLGTYGDWGQIVYNGSGGWVYMDYLKIPSITVTATFDANGGSASFTSKTYTAGDTFGSLPTASKTNRNFLGWTDGLSTYTENSVVPAIANLALKAKWGVLNFRDVSEDIWYAKYVEDTYNRGLVKGMTNEEFGPNLYTSRAQMVTLIGRVYEQEAGITISSDLGSGSFTDVSSGAFYTKYVAWGHRVGLVKGVTETQFWPDANITREQIAEFLYRLAIYSGYTTRTDPDESVLSRFVDADSISGYTRSAISWAVQSGILQGDDQKRVLPKNSAHRYEIVTLLSRYVSYTERSSKRFAAPESLEESADEDAAAAEEASAEEPITEEAVAEETADAMSTVEPQVTEAAEPTEALPETESAAEPQISELPAA